MSGPAPCAARALAVVDVTSLAVTALRVFESGGCAGGVSSPFDCAMGAKQQQQKRHIPMSVDTRAHETDAEYALRTLTEALAYFSPTHDLVRARAATKRSDNPDLAQAA